MKARDKKEKGVQLEMKGRERTRACPIAKACDDEGMGGERRGPGERD
jgi:hypothetical protein